MHPSGFFHELHVKPGLFYRSLQNGAKQLSQLANSGVLAPHVPYTCRMERSL